MNICFISRPPVMAMASQFPQRRDHLLKSLGLMGHKVCRFTIRPLKLPSLYLAYGLGIMSALIRFRKIKTDLILADDLESAVLAMLAKYIFGLPFVFDFIDDYASIARYGGRRIRGHLLLFLGKTIPKFADLVTVPCEEIRRFCLKAGVPKDKLVLVPNGVDHEVFKPQDRDERLRKDLGIGDLERVVLFVGRINRYYRLEVVLKAIPGVLEEIPETKFLFVGDGDDLERMKNLLCQLGIEDQVLFIGFRPQEEISRIINLADLCLFSLPYAMVLINFEYLACGKPVILPTREDKPKELLDDYLFWVDGSPSGFSQGIIYLLNNEELRVKIGQKGRETVVNLYASDISGERYETVLKEVQSSSTKD